jgi:hypothetical protein
MDKFNALQFKESQKAIECRQVIEHQVSLYYNFKSLYTSCGHVHVVGS